MNIVQMILKLLSSGDNLNKIASALGIGQEQAGKALSAAVPTLLAALAGVASKPGGGADLANVLAKQDSGVLDNISSLFSGGGAAASSKGSNMLGSLLGGLGGGALGQIGSVLSRFTGVNEGAINKLLGLLVPLVLGALKKQSKGQDAAGIARTLAEQKGNIVSALPPGLGSLLSSAVPGLSSLVGDTPSAAPSAVRTPTTEVRTPAREPAAAGSSVMKWLIPLVLLVLAFFLLPKMCRTTTETAPVVKETAPVVKETPAAATPAQDDSAKLIGDATVLIKDATDSVASIKDEASATAALPKLTDINTKLAGLQSQWAKLPQPIQKTVSDALRPLIAKLREAVQPVLALPVVGAKVKPIVDEMLGQLDKLIGATAAAAATAAKQTAGDAAGAASEAASKAADTATAAATTAKQTAGDAAGAASEAASKAADTATAAATTAKQTAGDTADAASEAASKAVDTATAAATTAKQTAGDAASAASEAASKAAETANAAATTAKQTAGDAADAASAGASKAAETATAAATTAKQTAGDAADAAGEATRDAGSAVADATSQAGRAAGAAAGATLDFARKLNSGYELKGVNEGIERQLVEFAESAKPTGEAAWFNFDRLTFETDSATIRMSESREQLQNIVEILKAYPTMRIKIGGYTDNTGDEAHNVQLSKARAEATEKALVSMGIDASRLDVEGYGSQNPVASNDTEEGRARNRRVAVSVVQR